MTTPVDLGPLKNVGITCQTDQDCGREKHCWDKNFFDANDGPVVQGGYCTKKCGSDTDCGNSGVCVAMRHPGTGADEESWCLAKCSTQSDCNRATNVLECWSGFRFDTGVCYPSTPGGVIQRCSPSTASCALPGSQGIGGCVRRSFSGTSALALCEPPCVAGKDTCTADPLSGGPRECLVNNPTVNRDGTPNPNTNDKFKGTACVPVPPRADAKATSLACVTDAQATSYAYDVCVTGDQCRADAALNADRLCRQLCYNPANPKPTATMGTVAEDCSGGKECEDAWSLFSSTEPKYQVGLCKL